MLKCRLVYINNGNKHQQLQERKYCNINTKKIVKATDYSWY